MNKVLILGGSGLVGKAIFNEMNHNAKYQPYATCCNHHSDLNNEQCFALSIEDIDNLYYILNTVKPDRTFPA